MFNTTVDSISNPLVAYWEGFVAYVPQLVGALVVLVVGLIAASLIGGGAKKLLELTEKNAQIKNFLHRWNISLKLSTFVGKFVWWVVFLVFLGAAVDILAIAVLSNTLAALVAYLPSLFAAAVVAVVVLFGARIVRTLVESALEGVNFAQSRGVGLAVYIVLVVFGLTAAAAQLGLDTSLITANLTVIVGGVVLALALAFGFGGKDVANKIVNNFYEDAKSKKRK